MSKLHFLLCSLFFLACQSNTSQSEKSATAYIHQADALMFRNRDSAILLLEKAHLLESNNSKTLLSLGDLYLQTQRYPDAIATYKTALSLNPSHGETAQMIAMIYSHLDSLDLAARYYLEAEGQFLHRLKIAENDMEKNLALSSLAMNYGIQGQSAKMKETLHQIGNEEIRNIWLKGAEKFDTNYVKKFFLAMEEKHQQSQTEQRERQPN